MNSALAPIKGWGFLFTALCCAGICLAFPTYGASLEKNELASPLITHSPAQPRSGQSVTITARLGADAKTASLEYQVVEPGNYIPLKDPQFKLHWTNLPMSQSGLVFTAQVPASIQAHRRLIRYRIKEMTSGNTAIILPSESDPEPNFAYFVYDGIPAWKGAIQPHGSDPKNAQVIEFAPEVMAEVQNYFLLGKAKEIESATWYDQSSNKEYKYTGTFVADGKVYDHVRFRARGGVWRHAMGKNMWKVDFNKGHSFEAKDDYGQRYKTKWSKLNLRACIQQGDYGRRGEQGMYESVGFRLFNLAGVPAPRTHWISWRIIDESAESPPNQYRGDYWGLYLAIENEDRHFLTEHNLPDGNLYKMMMGEDELSNHGANQVTNKSDLAQLLGAFYRTQPESWWQANVDLPRYYSYRSILEAIHHYDISSGKNYDFYRNPETSQWITVPWDIDLTWGDHMYGGGSEPFERPILSRPGFRIDYQNRLREIRDLLFNPDETDRLIDECAALISNPKHQPSIVDADRAKWDYHPIMISRYAMRGKADQGRFYQASDTGDFAGMVRQMKEYVRTRATYIDNSLIKDRSIPNTPMITFSGKAGYSVNGLAFKSSPFSGIGTFAAIKWRVGEIDSHKSISTKPIAPGHYEITPVWESSELSAFNEEVTIPANSVRAGHLYRARVRMKDTAGHWSHWSAPVQFAASE